MSNGTAPISNTSLVEGVNWYMTTRHYGVQSPSGEFTSICTSNSLHKTYLYAEGVHSSKRGTLSTKEVARIPTLPICERCLKRKVRMETGS